MHPHWDRISLSFTGLSSYIIYILDRKYFDLLAPHPWMSWQAILLLFCLCFLSKTHHASVHFNTEVKCVSDHLWIGFPVHPVRIYDWILCGFALWDHNLLTQDAC